MHLISTLLIGTSALIIGLLGLIHLIYTFIGTKLEAQDPELRAAMRTARLNLTDETTVGRSTKGFNASHSLGALFFAAVYGYLATKHIVWLQHSPFLLAIGFILLLSLFGLAKRYWFKVPTKGIALATILYGVGCLPLLLNA
ncbi:MAG: hypothetical protein KBC57_10975 [Neisseriaceae bacterium]|nr:hypothetical protein [Neisseriaceae bacterium]MBP6862862.1 hypothetical protein [Neisseriaceae bacterium]